MRVFLGGEKKVPSLETKDPGRSVGSPEEVRATQSTPTTPGQRNRLAGRAAVETPEQLAKTRKGQAGSLKNSLKQVDSRSPYLVSLQVRILVQREQEYEEACRHSPAPEAEQLEIAKLRESFFRELGTYSRRPDVDWTSLPFESFSEFHQAAAQFHQDELRDSVSDAFTRKATQELNQLKPQLANIKNARNGEHARQLLRGVEYTFLRTLAERSGLLGTSFLETLGTDSEAPPPLQSLLAITCFNDEQLGDLELLEILTHVHDLLPPVPDGGARAAVVSRFESVWSGRLQQLRESAKEQFNFNEWEALMRTVETLARAVASLPPGHEPPTVLRQHGEHLLAMLTSGDIDPLALEDKEIIHLCSWVNGDHAPTHDAAARLSDAIYRDWNARLVRLDQALLEGTGGDVVNEEGAFARERLKELEGIADSLWGGNALDFLNRLLPRLRSRYQTSIDLAKRAA